jgi:hypothetical protein
VWATTSSCGTLIVAQHMQVAPTSPLLYFLLLFLFAHMQASHPLALLLHLISLVYSVHICSQGGTRLRASLGTMLISK